MKIALAIFDLDGVTWIQPNTTTKLEAFTANWALP